jgi:tetratricopeptide (TPR) repeat protein
MLRQAVPALALTALLFASASRGTMAQTSDGYGGMPAPRTTDAATLRDLAIRREIRERFALGIAALNRKDYAAAISEFEAVIQRNPPEPQNSTAHYNMALALARSGNPGRAAAELRAAIARDRGFLAAYANLVSVDLQRGDLNGAREAADSFVSLAPESARALYSRGLTALHAGDVATARADFTKLLQKNPAYAPAHYDIALVELKAGRVDVAERELEAALSAAPDYPRARFALGVVLLREGHRDEARVAFEQVVHDAADPGLRNLAGSMRDTLTAR